MEKFALLALFLLLRLVIAGILKIGIWIGAKRATDAILTEFEFQVSSWEQLTYPKTELDLWKKNKIISWALFKITIYIN